MFDDFDTMIQSDEFDNREYEDYLLYCAMMEDYDGQEDNYDGQEDI